jgi:two-component system response regulator PilR (NtrC family)
MQRLTSQDEATAISPEAMQRLVAYSYPGNVRELENILERALVLGGSIILPEHLPETLSSSRDYEPLGQKRETSIIIDESLSFPINLDTIMASIERSYIERALQQSSGERKRAAELLGVNMRSFRYRCQKFDIEGS